ncbi:DUF5677 domain-containing protein [Herbaspirillum huttiense]|uniref:DUF5677 domain-containing protein n=1 Tax=Herbaspirillum huttiense TaxID=863372 RepID=UPI0031DFDB93
MSDSKINGFLSPALRLETRKELREKFNLGFGILEDLNRVCLEVIEAGQLTPDKATDAKKLMFVCFIRLVKSIQASSVLCEMGFANEAANQARAAMETVIIMSFLRHKPSETVALLKEQDLANVVRRANAHIYAEKDGDVPNEKIVNALQDEIKKAYAENGGSKPRDLNIGGQIDTWKLKDAALYKGPFQMLSAFGAHTTLRALNSLSEDGKDGAQFKYGVVLGGLEEVLAMNCLALIQGYQLVMESLDRSADIRIHHELLAIAAHYYLDVIPQGVL